MYVKCVQLLLGHPDIRDVVDVGAGRSWQFSIEDKERYGIRLIGVELDPKELALNQTVDVKVIGDATKELDLADASADLILCHAGVEHFTDNSAFLDNVSRILRPGGHAVLHFPNSSAPFAILNRVLPKRIVEKALRRLMPGSEGILGFEAHYDRTKYSEFSKLFRSKKLVEDFYYPGYFSSSYFAFFLPLYCLSLVFDLCRFATGARSIASYNLFILRKEGAGEESPAVRWT